MNPLSGTSAGEIAGAFSQDVPEASRTSGFEKLLSGLGLDQGLPAPGPGVGLAETMTLAAQPAAAQTSVIPLTEAVASAAPVPVCEGAAQLPSPMPATDGRLPSPTLNPVDDRAGSPFNDPVASSFSSNDADPEDPPSGISRARAPKQFRTDPSSTGYAWTVQQALSAAAAIAAQPAASLVPARAHAAGRTPALTAGAAPRSADRSRAIADTTVAALAAATLPIASGPATFPPKRLGVSPLEGGPSDADAFAPAVLSPTGGGEHLHFALAAPVSQPARNGELNASLPSIRPEAAHMDSAVRQLDEVLRDISAVAGASGKAAFRITSEQLGPVEVRLQASEAGMAVTIRTHDDHSRSAIAQAQHSLSDDLRANGIKVAGTQVDVGGGDRQRQDRPGAPSPRLIEVAAETAHSFPTPNETPLDGRYA